MLVFGGLSDAVSILPSPYFCTSLEIWLREEVLFYSRAGGATKSRSFTCSYRRRFLPLNNMYVCKCISVNNWNGIHKFLFIPLFNEWYGDEFPFL